MVQVPLRGAGTDGRYDHTKPADQLPSWSYNRPWATKEEQLTTQAIAMALASAPEVQDTVRPPLPQVNLFPPRFGYRTRAIGVADVVDVDELYKAPPNYAGTEAGYSGTARNAWGSGSW
jgi:hypothetical protein